MQISRTLKLSLISTIVTIAVAIFGVAVWLRIGASQDGLIQFVPASAVAYVHVRTPSAFAGLQPLLTQSTHPDVLAVLAMQERFSVAAVPYDDLEGVRFAPLIVFETKNDVVAAATVSLKNAGYDSMSVELPLRKRSVIAASPALAVVRQATAVAARERPDYRSNIATLPGIREHHILPASISVRINEIANVTPRLADHGIGLLAESIRAAGIRTWSAGVDMREGVLIVSGADDRITIQSETEDADLAFSVGGMTRALTQAQYILRADQGVIGDRYRSFTDQLKRNTGKTIEDIAEIVGDGSLQGVISGRKWSIHSDRALEMSRLSEVVAATVAGMFPDRHALRLRDGGIGYAWAPQTDVRTTDHGDYMTVTDGNPAHEVHIFGKSGVTISSPDFTPSFQNKCVLAGDISKNEYIYLRLDKISDIFSGYSLELHSQDGHIFGCFY